MSRIDLGFSTDWVLKGQGNANAVFGYVGANASLDGQVLRVRKLLEGPARAPDQISDQLTKQIWGNTAHDSQDVSQHFAALLGTGEYLTLPVQLQLTDELLNGLNNQLCSDSPAAQELHLSSTGCLLPDCTVFLMCQAPSSVLTIAKKLHSATVTSEPGKDIVPSDTAKPPAVLCFEIKPKWGLLPSSPAIPPKHYIKRQVSRFQLHQQLKLAQGKISSLSKYDPLDLFSANPARMTQALQALLARPQNNLKLFMDGQPVQLPDSMSSLDEISAAVRQALKSCLNPETSCRPIEVIAMLLQQVLSMTGILEKLLSIQALDEHDIEAIYPLYQHIMQHMRSLPITVATEGTVNTSWQADERQPSSVLQPHELHTQQLLSLAWTEQMKLLHKYLVATAAKDCSIMIRLQAMPHVPAQYSQEDNTGWGYADWNPANVVCNPAVTLPLRFKVTIVDLDRKPHEKIVSHHHLDQQIMFHIQKSTQ